VDALEGQPDDPGDDEHDPECGTDQREVCADAAAPGRLTAEVGRPDDQAALRSSGAQGPLGERPATRPGSSPAGMADGGTVETFAPGAVGDAERTLSQKGVNVPAEARCLLDRSRPCGGCVAADPVQCPYAYLLADLYTLRRRAATAAT
jgi:hypothetical protein